MILTTSLVAKLLLEYFATVEAGRWKIGILKIKL